MREFQVTEESFTALAELARVPIAFKVEPEGSIKDYDALPGQSPLSWPNRFDISHWKLVLARRQGRCIGGATLAISTPGLTMLEARDDVAVLWDIRVEPEYRHQGVGSALFGAAESVAGHAGCRLLKIETQDINRVACRFYERMGCELRAINRKAYPDFPDEIQLLWYKEIAAPSE